VQNCCKKLLLSLLKANCCLGGLSVFSVVAGYWLLVGGIWWLVNSDRHLCLLQFATLDFGSD